MQHALMAVRGLCHTACHTATNQQRDEAKAPPAQPWDASEFSRDERFDVRVVHGTDAHSHPHKPLVQVTMDTEQKLDE